MNETYSKKRCYRLCTHLFALHESNCSCNSTLDDFERDCVKKFYQQDTTTFTCVSDFLNNFRRNLRQEKCLNYCPLECDSMSFTIFSYVEQYPQSGMISDKIKADYSLELYDKFEEVNKHLVVLYVYYDDLEYVVVSQEPKTETFNLISNIGGLFGVFLGISFLSFFEIFEVLFEILVSYLSKNVR